MYLGGIVGELYASNKEVTVRNCVNYGSVTHSGTAGSANIGGIVGESYGGSSNKAHIQNCLNYGTINLSGATLKRLYIGGILGYAWSGTNNNIENCVSGGKITSNKGDDSIGSVVGYANSGIINISRCYWSSDVGYNKATGGGTPTIDNETKQVSLNTAIVNSLNNYNGSWNKWFMLYLNGGASTASTKHHLL